MAKRKKIQQDIPIDENEDNVSESLQNLNDTVLSITDSISKLDFGNIPKDLYNSLFSLVDDVKTAAKTMGTKDFESTFGFFRGASELLDTIKKEKILESQFDDNNFGKLNVIPQLNKLKDLIFSLNSVYGDMNDMHENIINSLINSFDVRSEVQQFLKPVNYILDKISSLPFGEAIIKAFKLDTLQEEIEKNVTQELAKAFVTGEGGFSSLSNVAIKAISSIGNGLITLLLNPIVLIGGAIAVLATMFVKSQQASKEFLKNTGLTLDKTQKFRLELEDTAKTLTKFGISSENVFESANSVYDKYQDINVVTKDIVKNVSILANNFNLSTEEATDLYDKILAISNGSEKTANIWTGTLIKMSDLAGTPIRSIFKDIVENSEVISKYFKGNVKELARTVIESRKLGLNLSKISDVLDNIMNFDESINKELEASLLLGKSINLNRARQLAFEGKIGDSITETFKQIGLSLESFNNMNIYQKEAIANLVGQTISELEHTLAIEKAINSIDKSKKSEYDKYVKLLEKGNDINADLLLDQKRQQYILEEITDSIKSIGTSLSRIILPIIYLIEPVLAFIAHLFESISDFINDNISNTENWITKLLKAGLAIGAIWTTVKLIKLSLLALGKLTGLGSILTGLGGSGGGIGSASKGIKSFFDTFSSINLKSLLGFALTSAILIASLYGLSFALKEFNDVNWSAALIGMTSLLALVGIISIIGAIMSSGVGTLAILAGAGAVAILSGALWILGEALQSIAKALPDFSAFLITLSIIGDKLFVAANGIMAVAAAMMFFASSTLINGLLSFFTKDPINQFERLAFISNDLLLTAQSIDKLNSSISNFNNLLLSYDNIEKLTDTITKLDDINSSIQSIPNIQGLDKTAENYTNIYGNNNEVITELKNIINSHENKMNEMIKSIENIKIYMDGKQVGKVINKSIQSVSVT